MEFERRIIVIDDDSLLRGLLTTQLRVWGFAVRDASNPVDATKLCREFDPDAVLVDVDLGSGINGFQLVEALVRQQPQLSVIFLTRFPDARASISRLSPSIRNAGFVSKHAVLETNELLEVINGVLNNNRKNLQEPDTLKLPIRSLTNRQLEILKLIHDGQTNQQIAASRNISLSAVENIVGRIFKKLGLKDSGLNNRAKAVRQYAESYGYPTT